MTQTTRRSILKGSLALAATAKLDASELLPRFAEAEAEKDDLSLNCNSGVTLPPTGVADLKFSFDFPEPSVRFGPYLIGLRIYTDENTYGLDPEKITVHGGPSRSVLECKELTWAGAQQKRAGTALGTVESTPQGIRVKAEAHIPNAVVTSIAVIVRWVPRGELSVASNTFYDPKQNEVKHSWADLMGGMTSPIIVIRSGSQFTSVSLAAEQDTVRNAKFYLQPGPSGYRAELTYEREAWQDSETIATPYWHLRKGNSYAEVAAPHYEHVEKAFGLHSWSTRPDVPDWARHVSLVVALHGADWTGYIFNDYARQLEILSWVAQQIEPAKVLVFLPAWDGRYYWNYPGYETDPRMGGDTGFAQLISKAQAMGFHLVPMFGSNVANLRSPLFPGMKDALTVKPDGDLWYMNYVDWNNDRRPDGNYGFMNLGVASWRDHLSRRIVHTIEQFGVDGYFLDIVGTADNNRQADMFLGTRALVEGVQQRFPHVICLGEMHYDALLGVIPIFQADATQAYPAAFYKYGRMFEHLSWPAPGRGSTGVHEFGFSDRGKLPTRDQNVIPTLTVVDDTFDKYRKEMSQVIAVAREWKGYQG